MRRRVPCSGSDCTNDASNLKCPTCAKLGLPDQFFCSQQCFKSNWSSHKGIHSLPQEMSVMAEVDDGNSGDDDAFDEVGEAQRISVATTPVKKGGSLFELFGLDSGPSPGSSPPKTPPKSPRYSGGSISKRKAPKTLQTMISLDDLALLANAGPAADQSTSTEDSSAKGSKKKAGSHTHRGEKGTKPKKKHAKRAVTMGRNAKTKMKSSSYMTATFGREKKKGRSSLFSPRHQRRPSKDADSEKPVSPLGLDSIPKYEEAEDPVKTARVADVAAQLDVADIFATDEIDTLASKLVVDIFDEDVLDVIDEEKARQAAQEAQEAREQEEDLTELSGESEEGSSEWNTEEEGEEETEEETDEHVVVGDAAPVSEAIRHAESDIASRSSEGEMDGADASVDNEAEETAKDKVTPRELIHRPKYLVDNSHDTSEVGLDLLTALSEQHKAQSEDNAESGADEENMFESDLQGVDVDKEPGTNPAELDGMFEISPRPSQTAFSPRADELVDEMFDVNVDEFVSPRSEAENDLMLDVAVRIDAGVLEPDFDEPPPPVPTHASLVDNGEMEQTQTAAEMRLTVPDDLVDSGDSADSEGAVQRTIESQEARVSLPELPSSGTGASAVSPRQLAHMQRIADRSALSPRRDQRRQSAEEQAGVDYRRALVLLSPRGAPDSTQQKPSHTIVVDAGLLKETHQDIDDLISLVSKTMSPRAENPEPKVEPEPEPEVEVEPETEPEVEPGVVAEPKTEPEFVAEPKTAPKTEPEAEPQESPQVPDKQPKKSPAAARLKGARKGRGSKKKKKKSGSKKRAPRKTASPAGRRKAHPRKSPRPKRRPSKTQEQEPQSQSGPLKSPGTGPIPLELPEEGEVLICRCGQSSSFPLCDGSHVTFNESAGSSYSPFVASQQALDQDTVYICGCGHSNNRSDGVPFCDGSHTRLKETPPVAKADQKPDVVVVEQAAEDAGAEGKAEAAEDKPPVEQAAEDAGAEGKAEERRVTCGQCSHVISAGKRFCGGCGAAAPRKCSSCGHTLVRHTKFCGACGAPVEKGRSPAPRTRKHKTARKKAKVRPKIQQKQKQEEKQEEEKHEQEEESSSVIAAPVKQEEPLTASAAPVGALKFSLMGAHRSPRVPRAAAAPRSPRMAVAAPPAKSRLSPRRSGSPAGKKARRKRAKKPKGKVKRKVKAKAKGKGRAKAKKKPGSRVPQGPPPSTPGAAPSSPPVGAPPPKPPKPEAVEGLSFFKQLDSDLELAEKSAASGDRVAFSEPIVHEIIQEADAEAPKPKAKSRTKRSRSVGSKKGTLRKKKGLGGTLRKKKNLQKTSVVE